MQLNREKIQRMFTGSQANGGGGGGGDTVGLASEFWVENNYISKEFFLRLFNVHGEDENDDPVDVQPNDLETTITDIEAMFGFWTEQYLSALGQNSEQGGGGITLNAALASINNAPLGNPTGNSTVLMWNGTTWVYATMGSMDMNTVWNALAAATNQQINISHLTTALGSYFTQGSGISITNTVGGTGKTISLAQIQDLTAGTYRSVTVDSYGRVTAGTNPTTLAGYGITDALASNTTFWGRQIASGAVKGGIDQASYIEFSDIASGTTNGGYIDFHYGGNTTANSGDYTSRIIEDAFDATNSQGTLKINNILWAKLSTGVSIGTSTISSDYKLNVNGYTKTTRLYLADGVYLEYDSTNSGVHLVGAGFYSDSYVSALGANSGGGGGGGSDYIPLTGSDQIAGSLIPVTTNAYDLGDSTHAWRNIRGSSIYASNSITTYYLTVNSTATVGSLTASLGDITVSAGHGFKVTGKDDTYVLLAGGGTKLLSEIGGSGSVNSITIGSGGTNYTPDANGVVTLPSYPSSYALQQAANNFVYAGNEVTFIPSTYSGGELYINYRGDNGYLSTRLSLYHIFDGNRGYSSFELRRVFTYGNNSSWHDARDNSSIKNLLVSGYNTAYYPVVDVVTPSGDWSIGTCSETLYAVYTSNTDYENGADTKRILFPSSSGTIALTSDIASYLNSYLPLVGGVLTGNLTAVGYFNLQRFSGDANQYMKISVDDVKTDFNGYDSDGGMNFNFISNGTTVFQVQGFSGKRANVFGLLKVMPSYTSGVQDGIELYDNGTGSGEGLKIRFTSYSYTTGHTFRVAPDTGGAYIDSSLIWTEGNDGTGSGLDADLLDGKHNGELTASSCTGNAATATSAAACTGNSATATKLAASITLWGQSFDGSGNISGSLSNTGDVTPSATTTYSIGSSSLKYSNGYIEKLYFGKSFLSNETGYVTFGCVSNEFRVGADSGSLYINYRGVSGKTTVTEWRWYAGGGSSGGFATHYIGTLYAYGTLNVANTITLTGGTAAKQRIYFDSTHYIELDSSGYFHFSHGVYSDGFVSALGLNSGGGGAADYIPLSGSTSITGDLTPSNNNSVNLGSSSKLWASVYCTNLRAYGASSIGGNLTMAGNITPTANNQYALGTSSAQFGNAFVRCARIGHFCIETDTDGNYSSSRSNEINNYNGVIHLQYDSTNGVTLAGGGGNVAVGTTSVVSSHKLYVSGSLYCSSFTMSGLSITGNGQRFDINTNNGAANLPVYVTGTWYGTFQNGSDIRLKSIHKNIDSVNVNDLSRAPIFDFTWIDGRDKDLHLGSSAQFWRDIFPNAISTMYDGHYAMDYGATALAAAVITARKVVDHEARIRLLEVENAALRNEINQLKKVA